MTARVLGRVALALALPVALFAVWWIASTGSQNFYYPPLKDILATFGEVWTGEQLRTDVLPSLGRLGLGYAIALVGGIALGVLIGSLRWLRAALEPVLEFFRAIPPPVLVPVIVLFAGIGNISKVLVIAFGCVWPVLLNTVEGVRAVDEVLDDTCRSYRVTGLARLRHLVLRGASPQIVTGARQALSIAIILMVISEMFAASSGIGFKIVEFQRTFAIPEMWSGIILLGLLGFALSLLFRLVENRILNWYHGLRVAQRRS
jgi:ABC-type nitrate/sulfonate/bicarbonate transport system permease component